MENIITPVDRELLLKELNGERFLRKTNYGNKEIYIVTAHNSPNTIKEIGRLREISFRDAGGGTGLSCDLDKYDTSENPYKQLIVWNPVEKEIVGGYRFIEGYNIGVDEDGTPSSATAKLFHFGEEFVKNYLPYTIELGRSFVQPNYQPSFNVRKGMFSLDNLWDGLGAITVDYPHIKYFFGKITMYPSFNVAARDCILFFMNKYFPDKDKMVYPYEPVNIETPKEKLDAIFTGNSYSKDYKILIKIVRRYGEYIPPLVNAYMNLSSTMKMFGTAINRTFGEVEETGILVNIEDIYEEKKHRHISTYKPKNK